MLKHDYARQISEAQVDLNRVARKSSRILSPPRSDCPFTPLKQVRLINRLLDRVKQNKITSIDLEIIKPVIYSESLEGGAKFAAVLVDSAGELTRLERYERRALSRRKCAIHSTDAAARSP